MLCSLSEILFSEMYYFCVLLFGFKDFVVIAVWFCECAVKRMELVRYLFFHVSWIQGKLHLQSGLVPYLEVCTRRRTHFIFKSTNVGKLDADLESQQILYERSSFPKEMRIDIALIFQYTEWNQQQSSFLDSVHCILQHLAPLL